MVQISWNARRHTSLIASCWVSVDETDSPISEPSPFDPGWYSLKFKTPELRCEVELTIQTGEIECVHGPFAPGEFNDVAIFGSAFKKAQGTDEKVVSVAATLYPNKCCVTPLTLRSDSQKLRRQFAIIRARREKVNERLKIFFIPHQKFSHQISLHSVCFHAVANL